ncbi:hypothetical protein ARMSODRAFT_981749 [Armillaria solidipes]|uniref:Uncharacterized protein n=1 Tax=Armillaria solidipes TaxID=1076256 RepID=A0A2H3AQZ0_9AGAR|nr:hypothetical protein ARMSODRAFT_981749 [Armillaria solidipes]
MPHWSQHAEDSSHLPEGFRRIEYDADVMQYIFTDENGKLYRSTPGEEYGTLTPAAGSVSTDGPGAFSDGEKPKVESSETAPKLTFSDFLPPSAMTSASASLDQYTSTTPLGAYLTGAVRTALPIMQGVVQGVHQSITSAYSKGFASRGFAPPLREAGQISPSNTVSPVDASVDESKSSEPKA